MLAPCTTLQPFTCWHICVSVTRYVEGREFIHMEVCMCLAHVAQSMVPCIQAVVASPYALPVVVCPTVWPSS